jgi:hypothetical protein
MADDSGLERRRARRRARRALGALRGRRPAPPRIADAAPTTRKLLRELRGVHAGVRRTARSAARSCCCAAADPQPVIAEGRGTARSSTRRAARRLRLRPAVLLPRLGRTAAELAPTRTMRAATARVRALRAKLADAPARAATAN